MHDEQKRLDDGLDYVVHLGADGPLRAPSARRLAAGHYRHPHGDRAALCLARGCLRKCRNHARLDLGLASPDRLRAGFVHGGLLPARDQRRTQSTQPLFVLAIRSLGCLPVFRSANCERPSLRETGGALLAIGGMAIILGPGMSASGSLTERHLIGSMMALGAAALSAAYAWLYRRLAEQGKAPDTNAVSLLTFAAGSVILLAAMVLVAMPSSLPAPSWENVALLLGLGIVSTAIPTVGFSMVSRRLPAIVTATVSLLVPVFGGLSAFLVLGERLAPNFLVGCVPVLGGVALIVRRRRG